MAPRRLLSRTSLPTSARPTTPTLITPPNSFILRCFTPTTATTATRPTLAAPTPHATLCTPTPSLTLPTLTTPITRPCNVSGGLTGRALERLCLVRTLHPPVPPLCTQCTLRGHHSTRTHRTVR